MHTLKESVIVYKNCEGPNGGSVLVTLRLQKGTLINKNINWAGKNRASRAKVIRIQGIRRDFYYRVDKDRTIAFAHHRRGFTYKVGKIVKPESAFSRGHQECASGIHFFKDKDMALHYWA